METYIRLRCNQPPDIVENFRNRLRISPEIIKSFFVQGVYKTEKIWYNGFVTK